MAEPTAPADRDLDSIREARALLRVAQTAQSQLAELDQDQVDRIVDAAAEAAAATKPRFVQFIATMTPRALQ